MEKLVTRYEKHTIKKKNRWIIVYLHHFSNEVYHRKADNSMRKAYNLQNIYFHKNCMCVYVCVHALKKKKTKNKNNTI